MLIMSFRVLPSRRARMRLFAALLALLVVAPASEAPAQDFFSDLFGGVFGGGGGGRRRSYERPPPRERRSYGDYERDNRRIRRMAPHSQPQRRTVARPTPHEGRPSHEGVRHVEKQQEQATFRIAVLGDAFSQMLADGLDESFESNPKIGVLRKGKDNSGLVRSDYFDWVKAAQEIADSPTKPDVAVVMIGGNDRQALGDESQAVDPLSPRWREIYGTRVDTLIQSLKDKGIPLIWVGLPIMKPAAYSAAIAQINEIFRSSSAKAGVPFVDLWDKFTDEHGQFTAFGPDINGQIVKLRSSDGIHFTGAGARKLAHFVEGEITRLYDARQNGEPPATAAAPASEGAPTPEAQAPAPAALPAAPVVFRPPAETAAPAAAPTLPAERPALGQVQSLSAVGGAERGDELAARATKPAKAGAQPIEQAVAAHVLVEGREQPTHPGRADDFAVRPSTPVPAPATTSPH
jgi:hypothetical protein